MWDPILSLAIYGGTLVNLLYYLRIIVCVNFSYPIFKLLVVISLLSKTITSHNPLVVGSNTTFAAK
jgi:hypothetical protein